MLYFSLSFFRAIKDYVDCCCRIGKTMSFTNLLRRCIKHNENNLTIDLRDYLFIAKV